jgi:hypothetical protein
LCLILVELFCQTFSLLACRNNGPENGQEDCVLRGFVMVGRGIGKMRLAGNFGIILWWNLPKHATDATSNGPAQWMKKDFYGYEYFIFPIWRHDSNADEQIGFDLNS